MIKTKKHFSFKYFTLFLLLNFAGLGFGIYLMNGGPLSNWYTELNQAPWTPPNPTFGIAWSFIMICFAFFMGQIILKKEKQIQYWIIFWIQWILNSGWNLMFFNLHETKIGLLVLILLFGVVLYLSLLSLSLSKKWILLNLPYLIWLMIAISLNWYIIIAN